LSGPIRNGSVTGFSVSAYGSGVVIISGTQNTYTGVTGIVRGILKLGAENALPTGTTLDVDNAPAAEDSTFDLNGFNQTVGALQRSEFASAGKSFLTNTGTSAATLTVNQSGNTTFSGVIRDGSASGIVALT
jgi:autotransporter-associated beta strand protein